MGTDLSDRGGKKAILETIKVTRQPIILIVNDFYSLIRGSGEGFKSLCTLVPFYEVDTGQIVELLKRICRDENISADLKLLQTLAERCRGDVRSAVNDLQSISADRNQVDVQALDVLGYRDREKIIFDALRDVFKSDSIQSIRRNIADVDIEPETFLLWVAENLPREYRAVDDLARGYEALSKADVFFGRVSRRQYYGLWSYACDLMNGGVALAKTHSYGPVQYAAPQWMREMKTSKNLREIRDSVSTKITKVCHHSRRKSKESFLSFFRQLFRNDIRFACAMKQRLDLSENEILYLLGERYASRLQEILNYCEKADESQVELDTAGTTEVIPADTGKTTEKQEVKQPSLFDF